ncbi:MAG: phosphatase PAP2 family protein [Rhodoferax sp.]
MNTITRMSPIKMRRSSRSNVRLTVIVATIIFLVAAVIFGNIGEDVASGDPLTLLDAQIATWFHMHTTPSLTYFMWGVSYIYGVLGISVGALLFGAFLVRKREWFWLKYLVLAVLGGMLLNVLIKDIFGRTRPTFSDPILSLASYSFPSGHVAGTTLLYGVIAVFITSRIDSRALRASVVFFTLCMITLVALSRLYLGAHFLSDVVAAFAEGVAWLAFCFTALQLLRRN